MARSRYRPHIIARRALLGVLLLLVIGVGWLFLYRRSTVDEGVRPPAAPRELARGSEQVLSGEGFEYGVSEEGRERFRVEADRIVSDRSDNVVLEGVKLTMVRENDRLYTVEGDLGVYTVNTSNAEVEGNVTLRGPNGLELLGEKLELRREGKVLVNRKGEVTFTVAGQYRGRADDIYYHLKKDIVRMSGDVRIESIEDDPVRATLTCDRLLFERRTGLIHIEGNVQLVSARGRVAAGRLGVQLDESGSQVRFIRGIWGVEGQSVSRGGLDMSTTTEFSGDSFSAVIANSDPVSAELDGGEDQDAVVETRDGAGLWRRMEAPSMTADFTNGVPQVFRAFQGVEIVDRLDFGDRPQLRKVCSEWALASFDAGGEAQDLVLGQHADFQEPGLHAFGDRIESAGGQMSISGRPANVLTDRGHVTSERILYRPAEGVLEAPSDVRAELPPGGRFSLMGADEKEPVRLTARSALWSDELATIEFEGDVRAWQGDNYLLAQRLVGEAETDLLRAEGRVRTVIRSTDDEETEEPVAGDAEGEDGGEAESTDKTPPGPVEVTANELLFRREERLATYVGQARAHQAGRSLSCQELDIQLGEQGRFDSLTCREDTTILDPEEGNTVTGQEAYYRPDTGLVEITGTPVTMKDREGTSISGSILIYDFESGTARVKSGDPRPAEAEPQATP